MQNEESLFGREYAGAVRFHYIADETGKWMDKLPWGAVIGRAHVQHSSQIADPKVHYNPIIISARVVA